jgi:DNA-binding winged helix-turn-helix (wHTH) protein/TolB-like protein
MHDVCAMADHVQFGPFSFELSAGALRKNGLAVRLQPQPARVLAVLVTRAGDIVSRDELRQQIWPEGTFVDFERGLNFSIAQVRAALGDTADSPRYIETLPKRGYRFIAPVSREGAIPERAALQDQAARLPSSPLAAQSPKSSMGFWLKRRSALAAAATIACVAVGLAVWPRPEPGVVRVAVVPFDNETGQDAFDRVAVAIADQTVARLAVPERLSRLSVIGNAAALRQPRTFRDIKSIGQAVGAQYVVLAQMKVDQSTVRLIAHLIRVSDEAHVWANTFDRSAFTLDVQAEIAEAIADAVTIRLTS